MADLEGQFINDSGVTELEGLLRVTNPIVAEALPDATILNSPSLPGIVLVADGAGNASWAGLLSVTNAPPVVLTTLFVFDNTAVTGGLYIWDSSAYVQVGGPI
jgi:hypothetical protein